MDETKTCQNCVFWVEKDSAIALADRDASICNGKRKCTRLSNTIITYKTFTKHRQASSDVYRTVSAEDVYYMSDYEAEIVLQVAKSDGCHSDAFVVTEPDFGCTKFEPKGDFK